MIAENNDVIADLRESSMLAKLSELCGALCSEIDHVSWQPILTDADTHRIAALKHDILASVHHICAIYGDCYKNL